MSMRRRDRTGAPMRSPALAPTAAGAAAEKMPTSAATDPPTLLSFAGDGWLLVESGGSVSARGGPDEVVDLPAGTRTALAVPGAEVVIHWLELAGGLTLAQAAAAAMGQGGGHIVHRRRPNDDRPASSGE